MLNMDFRRHIRKLDRMVVLYLLKFLEDLANIHDHEPRLTGEEDWRTALSTLYNRAERIVQSVARILMTIIELAQSVARILMNFHNIRERYNRPLKTPLREMVVVQPAGDLPDDIAGKLREYVREEPNVQSLVPCNDTLKYASLRAEPDFCIIGKWLGKCMGVFAKEIESVSKENILPFLKSGEVTIASHCLKQNDTKNLQIKKVLEVDATDSWDALGLTLEVQRPNVGDHLDIIIGMIDSGIDPESESFAADGIKPPPSSWKCHSDDSNFTCTNKIVGAKVYTNELESKPNGYTSIRDYWGHGTQCAAIAAGNPVDVCFDKFWKGSTRGGLPTARIAVYKVLNHRGSNEQGEIYHAIRDAVDDGVDILSISMGEKNVDGDTMKRKVSYNDIDKATFYAMTKGVLSCVSAGNRQFRGTVGNIAPWNFCSGASTSLKTFSTSLVLGKGAIRIKGFAVNMFPATEECTLICYKSAKRKKVVAGSKNIDSRVDGSLYKSKLEGKIVVYEGSTNGEVAFEANASGIIVICKGKELPASCRFFPLPAVGVTKKDGCEILKYIAEEQQKKREPVGRIYPSIEVDNYANYPFLASFSSKGPNQYSQYILKPDICAPGVEILTATSSIDDVLGDKGNKYTIVSGTSLSTAMLTGAAAYVKSKHLDWSPAAIRSALMTTASSMKKRSNIDVLGFGSGLMNPIEALNPGLIYEISPKEYAQFLLGQGEDLALFFKKKELALLNKEPLKPLDPCDLNLPSFAAFGAKVGVRITYHRKVTKVGGDRYYRANISNPESHKLHIEVDPTQFNFVEGNDVIPFTVIVTVKDWTKCEDDVLAGSLEWKSAQYSVKSPIVISKTEM